MKKIWTFLFLFACTFAKAQHLLSPKDFLGYELGNKFTPHYKIAGYFEQAAAAAPQMMKLEKYGETNEGRPLYISIIASPENFSRLEEIRKNNLRLTGLLNDQPGNTNAPAIVWLSFNVHGNEPSSSEVAMKLLYELLSRQNTRLNEWMKNVVVIIDPCLNPDGRDRYVNWFNMVSGKNINADMNAREHDEPWPGGRTNHYNFDLNRDWLWQTQTESQARLVKYRGWMPEIHCDFHEQYPDNPYYFAPAAEPVHEAITQWQKDFQVTVGRNHAKYFDANGWLYFTKQYFDLFYPSYGDTYPLFNGAIGMTYEQAGHSVGGLAVALSNGDTLTLADRIAHHFTTGISTIEAASQHAGKLVTEFKKYFDNAAAGNVGMYKAYVISNKNEDKLKTLETLLDKNQIRYGFAAEGRQVKGFNYFTGREENYTVQKNDLVITSAQPNATLVKVLFETSARLNDSATYDITAWALPYAYGLQTYGLKENIAVQQRSTGPSPAPVNANAYGYIISYNAFSDSKVLAKLLDEGVKLRFAETPFSYNGIQYRAGSIVILRKGNEDKIQTMIAAAAAFKSDLTAVSSGFMDTGFDFGSDKLHYFKTPKVAMVTGDEVSSGSAGEIWHLFDVQLNYPITLINSGSLANTDLKEYNVLIMPNGYYKALQNKDAAADLKTWVRNGGRLIVLENAAKQLSSLDWGFKLKKAPDDNNDDTSNVYANIKKYADREKESVTNNIPGAIYRVQLDETHPVGFGYPDFYFTLKQNDNVYEFLKEGWNIGVIKKQKELSGFVGSGIKKNIKDGTLIGEVPAGKGSVIFFADDPIFRSFWENGKMLFCNAVFFGRQ